MEGGMRIVKFLLMVFNIIFVVSAAIDEENKLIWRDFERGAIPIATHVHIQFI